MGVGIAVAGDPCRACGRSRAVGLLAAPRPGDDTVKRYAPAGTPERIQRVLKYRVCMVEMSALAGVVRSFVTMLAPHKDNPPPALRAAPPTATRLGGTPRSGRSRRSDHHRRVRHCDRAAHAVD